MERNKTRYFATEGGAPAAGNGGSFWAWRAQSGDEPAHLRLDGVIDSGQSWFDDTVTPRAFRAELDAHEGETIVVDINSPGGDIFAGFDILDMLQSRKGVTRVRIPALCASAASIIAMGADPGELVMTRTGMLMIHNPLVSACGNAGDLREQAAVLDEITDIMVGVYMDRFKGEESALRALLDAESYMTADEALGHGLIDRIEERESGSSASAQRYAACMQDVLGHIPGGVRSKGVPAAPKKPATGIDRRQALYEAEQQYHKIMKDE